MIIRNPRDLGLLIRDRRERKGLSQSALADLIGASRWWVIGVEKGKPKAEVGLVLQALTALDLIVDLHDPERQPGDQASLPAIDLAGVLSSSTGSSLDLPVTECSARE